MPTPNGVNFTPSVGHTKFFSPLIVGIATKPPNYIFCAHLAKLLGKYGRENQVSYCPLVIVFRIALPDCPLDISEINDGLCLYDQHVMGEIML